MSNSNIHTDQEELIVRYLTGNASATETQQLEKWVKADKKNKKQFLEYKHSWQFMHSTNVTFDTKKAWGSIIQCKNIISSIFLGKYIGNF